ncbi:MAG TPA: bifunctional pyr operon transcriptional regulator/uracil phosphoribosyltransferase PyrR [Deltaproteobacteria bacterium]|nr:bifunctional pyr operon transcriptional regulator/uracil phosphoribosyltransferase PyrR [Deltaproteobacteria bacterium]
MAEIPQGKDQVRKMLTRLAGELMEAVPDWEKAAFIGIRTGGDLIARNLAGLLQEQTGRQVPVGVLDITLYRDDISRRKAYPEVRSTDIPFAVDGKDIILVDDVLHTGRSVRAAIDQIVDLGRPRRIYLLVLFDRQGRELPIQADFAGMKISLPEEQVIKIESGPDRETIVGVLISEVKR